MVYTARRDAAINELARLWSGVRPGLTHIANNFATVLDAKHMIDSYEGPRRRGAHVHREPGSSLGLHFGEAGHHCVR
jgi:hypothetical protein